MGSTEILKSEKPKQPDHASQLRQKLMNASEDVGEHTMFKVPSSLKKADTNAFVPQIVAIGPYNWERRCDELQEMEYCKLHLLGHVIGRKSIMCTLEDCVNLVQDKEEEVRKCYSMKRMKIKTEAFVEMLLLDSFFILECFFFSNDEDSLEGHPIFTQQDVSPLIKRDLLMIENQLPLFVLIELYALIRGIESKDEVYYELSQLAIKFFKSVIPGLEIKKGWKPSFGFPFHLLGLVRWGMVPERVSFPFKSGDKVKFFESTFFEMQQLKDLEKGPQSDHSMEKKVKKLAPEMMVHSVTRLRSAGVTLERANVEAQRFTEIKYKNGKLSIPPLKINDAAKCIFLNLMVLEQYHPHIRRCVTSYVTFMDTLINTNRDVEYLKEKGIINHDFGRDQEVANLFNNIRKEIFLDPADYYLYEVSYKLRQRTKMKWRQWCSTLKHEYFTHPWRIMSIIAAAILLILTITQTVFTMLEYHSF